MSQSHRAAPATRTAKPTKPKSPASHTPEPVGAARWLLLIHQIPPKPDYLRVKIGRRLQTVGAMAIKNSVYALPPTAECLEDFQWIVREIEEGGGEAFISEASLVGDGLTDADVRTRFDAARNEDYRAILRDARSLLGSVRISRDGTRQTASRKSREKATIGSRGNGVPAGVEHELAKLRRRFEAVSRVDFFGASDGAAVAAVLAEIQTAVVHYPRAGDGESAARIDGATWVTRRGMHVDRIASAWLIRRFIDRRPRFRFVDANRYAHQTGELRFDMFEAEYTHVGDACTFETLVGTFGLDDPALREIGEIVHDVDCKDAKFRREEAPGLAKMIEGIAALYERDEERLERGGTVFDSLYAAFGQGRGK